MTQSSDPTSLQLGLERSRTGLVGRIRAILRGGSDDAAWEGVEEALIGADLGADLTIEVVTKARARRDLPPELALQAELIALFAPRDPTPWPRKPAADVPAVILVVGVNGTGKTTSIAKLAYRFHTRGAKVLLAAGDTFRAAAIDQLQTWAKRIDVPVVAHAANADPSAVVWDAMDAAAARGTDVVIVDTAGRLHTKHNLMEELAKIRRTIARRLPAATPEVLFVLDATTGQNGLTQAKAFHEAAGLTGIALTKLDSTSKGGIAFAIERALGGAGPVRGCRREGRGPARFRPQRIRPGTLRLIVARPPEVLDAAAVSSAAHALAGREPHLAALLDLQGVPPLWHKGPGFETLVDIVLGQQVSLSSARSALERVRAAAGSVTSGRVGGVGRGRASGCGPDPSEGALSGGTGRGVDDRSSGPGGRGRTSGRSRDRGPDGTPGYRPLDGGHLPADGSGSTGYVALHRSGAHRGDPDALGSWSRRRRRPRSRRSRRHGAPYRSVAARMLWQAYLLERGRPLDE